MANSSEDRSKELLIGNTILLESGGSITYKLEQGCSLRIEQLFDALTQYLESGKNEQALIAFLEA